MARVKQILTPTDATLRVKRTGKSCTFEYRERIAGITADDPILDRTIMHVTHMIGDLPASQGSIACARDGDELVLRGVDVPIKMFVVMVTGEFTTWITGAKAQAKLRAMITDYVGEDAGVPPLCVCGKEKIVTERCPDCDREVEA